MIRSVDDTPIRTPNDVIATIGRHVGGEVAAIDLVRDGRAERRSIVLRPFPRETLTGHTFEYGSVTVTDGSRLRTILSMPDRRQGPLPAVMLLQGGGCGSVDIPMAADVGQSGLMRTIAAHGYVTMRVEKSGVGDSKGPPCDTIGYSQELNGYRAALTALKRHPSVNPAQVYLLGISLGGVFAPVLADEESDPGNRGVRNARDVASTVSGPLQSDSSRSLPPSIFLRRGRRWNHACSSCTASSTRWPRKPITPGLRQSSTHDIPGEPRTASCSGLDHCWTRHDTMDKSRGNCGNGEAVPALADAVLAFFAGASR